MADPGFTFSRVVRPVAQIGLSATRTAEPTSWLDVSCHVHEAELYRGRDRFSDRFEPGTATITLSNADGWADLVGSPSVVAEQPLRPGRPIRIGVTGPWGDGPMVTRWLWRGWIDQCTPRYDPVLHDVVTINCIDALAEAGSSTVPSGAFQGANESVDLRIHRVLDEAGWFATKRKVDTSPTTVQGTSFGSPGIDLMSVAADSAGGVVFGDLDGDVVFRGIDWMLYDPDVPPDNNIGNVDPGTPGIPFDPGYIDPDEGYVYVPEPPPIVPGTVITVCAEDGNGSLVAQGDAANLYVEDGQLRFASSGRVWDMGAFDGGCTGVIIPDNIGGGGGGSDPIRIDDLDGDGFYEIAPYPAVPMTPLPPEVDLLAWSQGCPEDGTQASVSLGPVSPGGECVLIVLVAAQAPIGQGGSMQPVVSGGGLTWENTGIGFMDYAPPVIGTQAYYAVTERGVDPGTFTVTLDWPGTNVSRLHAAVLYRARGLPSSFVDALPANLVYGSQSAVPAANFLLPMEAIGWQPVRLQATDVTVALSLADRADASVGPFGATFDDGPYGTWVDGSAFVTKCVSWSTGTRVDATNLVDVFWSDLDTGPDDLTAGTIALVLETVHEGELSWQVYNDPKTIARPDGAPSTTGAQYLGNVLHPEPDCLLVVFVGITADVDLAEDITCEHGLGLVTFTRQLVVPPSGGSRGQGAIFTARVPPEYSGEAFYPPLGPGLQLASVDVKWGSHTVLTANDAVYMVRYTDPTTPVGAVVGAPLGDSTSGSVNGPFAMSLPTAPDAASVTLAMMCARAPGTVYDGGAATADGDDWHEDIERHAFFRGAYMTAMSREPGSTSPLVEWDDLHTGTSPATDGVTLAIEIRADPASFLFAPLGDEPLVIGGQYDPYTAPITSATYRDGTDPNSGDLIWSLDPGAI